MTTIGSGDGASLQSALGVKLTAENSSEFWNCVWESGHTRWREAEKSHPFTRNIFAFVSGLKSIGAADSAPLVVTKEMNEEGVLNGTTEVAVVASFLAEKTVLVPLCGDTPVIRYLADHGAKRVIGADLSPMGLLRQRESHFSDVSFEQSLHRCSETDDEVIEFNGTLGECNIKLFQGDFLKLSKCAAFCTGVDFVFDRASMMAMHPSLREPYVRTIAACLKPDGYAMVERPIRDPGDMSGPPFTFTVDEVRTLYEKTTGHRYDARVVVENHWIGHKNDTPGVARYFDFIGIYRVE